MKILILIMCGVFVYMCHKDAEDLVQKIFCSGEPDRRGGIAGPAEMIWHEPVQ